MASGLVISPPVVLNNFTFDSMSTLENANGVTTGSMVGEIVDSTHNQRRHRAHQSVPNNSKTMEFQASSRRSSLKKPNYYRLSIQPKPKRKSVNTTGGFQTQKEIEQIFDIYPKKTTNLPEYPSHMIEYFVKSLDLLKKNPNIDYQVLKAKIDVPKIAQIVEDERIKRHASMPNPIMNLKVQESAERLQKLNRKSAPTGNIKFHYEPIEMSMDEYLNTPLDLYNYRKHKKSVGSDFTFFTNTSSTGGNTQSGESYVDANGHRQLNRLGNERVLKTQRKDTLIHKKSVQFKGSIIPEEKLESSFEKFGVSPVSFGQKHQSFKVQQSKRLSNQADISIESGRDIYYKFKEDLFSQNFKTWEGMARYIHDEYPDYFYNEYLMTRLILEIYTRRITAARIALKISADKKKQNSDSTLSELKGVLTSVYGAQQASIL